ARKFFGVPDGAYLYTHIFLKDGLDQDISSNRFDHLIKRIDISPETAYPLYKENEERLRNQPMLEMSKLSRRILSSINYSEVATKRRKNYSVLHEQLKDYNKIDLGQLEGQIPMVYPFLTDNSSLRNVLIEEGVYTPQFWPNVLDWTNPNSLE